MKYSASTGGFYDEAIHGDAIPLDAIDIEQGDYEALIDGQVQGKRIEPGANGLPRLVDPPAQSPAQLIKFQIVELEAQQDARRVREAVLGIDGGWLANLNAQIAALRAQLS